MNSRLMPFLVVGLLLTTGCVGRKPAADEPAVGNFWECVYAGYPVVESFPRQCVTPDGVIFTEVITTEMTRELCETHGGNYNECSSRCSLNNQGKGGVMCLAVCEVLCECGGITGFTCPPGFECKKPSGIADALGYCVVYGEKEGEVELDQVENTTERMIGFGQTQIKNTQLYRAEGGKNLKITRVLQAACSGCFQVDYTYELDSKESPILGRDVVLGRVVFENWKVVDEVANRMRVEGMSISEAFSIAAESECTKEGNLSDNALYNENTKTWWIDLDVKKEGCAPACVVSENTKTAQLNYRCTGLIE